MKRSKHTSFCFFNYKKRNAAIAASLEIEILLIIVEILLLKTTDILADSSITTGVIGEIGFFYLIFGSVIVT